MDDDDDEYTLVVMTTRNNDVKWSFILIIISNDKDGNGRSFAIQLKLDIRHNKVDGAGVLLLHGTIYCSL